jgi:hypothetical protein
MWASEMAVASGRTVSCELRQHEQIGAGLDRTFELCEQPVDLVVRQRAEHSDVADHVAHDHQRSTLAIGRSGDSNGYVDERRARKRRG